MTPATVNPKLSPDTETAIDAVIAKHAHKTPAVSFGAVTADGILFLKHRGDRVYGQPEQGPVNDTTTLHIYSMTKFITSLAVLQQVEKGVLSYDDSTLVAKYAPELAASKILKSYDDGKAVWEDLSRPPTLRELVNHTSGLGYDFFRPHVAAYCRDHNLGRMFGGTAADMAVPFMFQPGTALCYGLGVDWAGIILERATGLSLEEYFRQHILDPLGVSTDTTFANPPDVLARRQHCVHRLDDGGLSLGATLKPLDGELTQLAGGTGMWSTAKDYLLLLQGVLKCREPGGIISPDGFKLLFEDALPKGSTAHTDLAEMIKGAGSMDEAVYSNGEKGVGHSVALSITKIDSKLGRSGGSGGWGGAARTEFCIDPRMGMAFVSATQILRPPGSPPLKNPDPISHCYAELERTLYDHVVVS